MMLSEKPIPVIVYVPSARCGKAAVFETAHFIECAEHRLGVRIIKLEKQLAYDLNPAITEEAADEFCLDQLHTYLMAGLDETKDSETSSE
ncbi:MAG: hypothetical protein IJ530_05410 [Treponema sp.]|uniref:hypothetical protein n=1 Tax=Treponema sp. TaxID=166 RepID=UPI0025F71DCA|nr:hypothetical protein [Treponema sp.]MBQ8679185.1 hypothetical protein [Treponema sp.]